MENYAAPATGVREVEYDVAGAAPYPAAPLVFPIEPRSHNAVIGIIQDRARQQASVAPTK